MRALFVFAVLVAIYAAFEYRNRQVVVTEGNVVITGASSGIGRHAAFFLAEKGFHVFASFRKESDRVSLEKEAAQRGVSSRLIPLQLEVTSEESVLSAVRTVGSSGRPLVAVVLNAGVTGGGTPLQLESEAQLRRVFETNFFGAIRTARLFLPQVVASRGRVVSVSSLKGSVATPGSSSYCATKAALDIAMRVLARETLHLGVRVVTVQPGYIATDILSNVQPEFVASQHALADSAVGKQYPGFKRYINETFSVQGKPQRGVSPQVTSEAIFKAIATLNPWPVLRAGGPEVHTVNILGSLVPDIFQDALTSSLFRYGEEDGDESLFVRIKRTFGG